VLRTIEQIVGISPMTQFDAAATPLLNSFSNVPNMATYTAIVPSQNVQELNPVNPPPLPGVQGPAATSLEAVKTLEDANELRENQVLWALYGHGPMPAPKTSVPDQGTSAGGDSGVSMVSATSSMAATGTSTTTSATGTASGQDDANPFEDPFGGL
jgi:hypothetical protein